MTPVLDLDGLESFISEKQYQDIPNVFPEDHGDIPKEPTLFDNMKTALLSDIEQRGISNFLLMKQKDEPTNYALVFMIYASIALIVLALSYVLKEMRNEMMGGGSSTQKVKKTKKND